MCAPLRQQDLPPPDNEDNAALYRCKKSSAMKNMTAVISPKVPICAREADYLTGYSNPESPETSAVRQLVLPQSISNLTLPCGFREQRYGLQSA
jgi:hypothetical protein